MRWNGITSVAHFNEHLERLKAHAHRLDIEWPRNGNSAIRKVLLDSFDSDTGSSNNTDIGLVKLRLDDEGTFSAVTRWKPISENQLTSENNVSICNATAVEAPRWDGGVTGCKHGDWQPYHDAGALANERGCEIALLIHDDAVVDCQWATPLLLDDDGTAWYPAPSEGCVDSISLKTITPYLAQEGIPLIAGRLTRNLISRAHSFIAIGSGIGVKQISEIDGQKIGSDSTSFANMCQQSFNSAIISAWFDLKEEKV
jgi:branched-subunit amino acid aminotransferase/4-amino-4-deoxychorismate lyase